MRLATVGKVLGLAGLAGVAATGVVLARDERQRRAYTPEDVRARLHQRAELATAAQEWHDAQGQPTPPMIELPGDRGEGGWLVRAAPTAIGRARQRLTARVHRLRAGVRHRRP